MNIVHILHGKANPRGHNGISRVAYFLNKHEKLLGNNSQIWAVVDGAVKHETLERDEYVTVELFPRVNIFNQNSSRGICKFIEEHRSEIDIVHFHMIWFYDKNIIAKTLKRLRIPFIITTHGTYSKPHAYTGKRLIAKWLFEVNYLNMANEIHILQRDEGYGNIKYGVKRPQFVIPNGIDNEEIPRERKGLLNEANWEGIKLLWIGVFREDKNLSELLKAISILPKAVKDKVSLILAGPDYNGNKRKLVREAEELHISQNIRVMEAVYDKDKYDLIESCDVYIMPSLSEGISMAILDALACGKPCILTKQCGMEYYLNRNFFFMCEPYAEDIARAVREMFDNSQALVEMGLNARTMIQDVFNWSIIAEQMIENYIRIVRISNGDVDTDSSAGTV